MIMGGRVTWNPKIGGFGSARGYFQVKHVSIRGCFPPWETNICSAHPVGMFEDEFPLVGMLEDEFLFSLGEIC